MRTAVMGLVVGLLLSCGGLQRRNGEAESQRLLASAVKIEVSFHFRANGRAGQGAISGSGVSVASEPGRSLVATASHVCAPEMLGIEIAPASIKIEAVRVSGQRLKAWTVYSNPVEDVCVLYVEGYAGPAVPLAKALPPIGATIQHAGAPSGLFGAGVGFADSCRYAGAGDLFGEGISRLFCSGTSTGGASGSGMIYRGEVVGILIAVANRSGYLVIGTNLDAVRAAVGRAKVAAW